MAAASPAVASTAHRQLVRKAAFVRRFEQAGPELAVNLDRSADHPKGQLVEWRVAVPSSGDDSNFE